MSIVVQKYGGSSVSDLAKIERVADRICATLADGHQVVAVVSAMGNTTNELLSLAHNVAAHPDRRELDMLLSTGERITMALLAMSLLERGIQARSLTGSQSGIITDERHADASVVAVRHERLTQVLEQGHVAIVAGFQGVSRQREVTTLGRGGSDTTAVVLAAALGAAWCEICSDVDGVWSADPRLVEEAHKLDQLSLSQAVELARGGAKVLFEDAVTFARDHGVEIHARSTFGPGSGTRLTPTLPPVNGPICVTHDDQLAKVPLDQVSAWVDHGARLRRVVGGEAMVDLRNYHGSLDAEQICVVTMVGAGIGEDVALVQAVAQRLDPLALGAAGDSIWVQVAPASVNAAVRCAHEMLA